MGKTDYARDMALVKGQQWTALLVLLGLLLLLPLALTWTRNASWLVFINFTIITIIAVLGLNITTGMAGQVSLGHSAFLIVGGYLTGILTLKAGWTVWAALPVAAIVTAVVGMTIAAPALRLKGFYIAIVTLAFFFVVQYIFRSLEIAGGLHGLIGIPRPSIGGLLVRTDLQWYYLLLPVGAVSVLASANISRSRLGRSFLAIRDNDIAAANLGINVPVTRLRAFFVGSLFAGLAGGLAASYVSVIRLDQFTIWDSIWYLGMIVIGGGGSTAGAVAGVVFLRLIGQIMHVIGTSGLIPLSSSLSIYITHTIFGLVIILFVSLWPLGLISLWRKVKVNYKRWPFGP